jgi:vacuolar protein sorting-associated protein 29
LPEFKVLTAGKLKFGLFHGHQIIPWGDSESLNNYMREQEVDVIISGHTHEQKIEKYEGKLFINPGSFTGAYGPLKLDVEPGFVVLEVKEKTIEAFFYKIVMKEVVVNKIIWTKGEKMK